MSTDQIRALAGGVDLRERIAVSNTVVASPALAAETVIAQVQPSGLAFVMSGILLIADADYTVGTSGTAVTFRIRQTGVAGALVKSTGAITGGITAGNLEATDLLAFDTTPTSPPSLYVLTMQVTAGAAASTVSATTLAAITI